MQMKWYMTVVSSVVLASLAGVASADVIQPVSANANLAQGILTDASSIHSFRSGYNGRGGTPGDTYGAAIIGQTATSAAFMTTTGRVTSFLYDFLPSVHGTLVGSGATVNIGESETVTGANTVRIVIDAMTADSSSMWPSGITIGGVAITQGRFDVGAGAFTDGILWNNLPGPITSVAITNAVLADGAVLATSSALTNGRTLPEMGALVAWNGVVGSIVDETQMIFDITYSVPSPASVALLGLGGLVATRRRR